MSLVIEDGSGLSTASSYVTVAEARAYALARGVTLSEVDATVEVLLIKAMDYIEAKRIRYQGYKASDDQALQWPRCYVWIDGYSVDSGEIPTILKNAQCQAAMEISDGIDPLPTGTGNGIKSETVGPLSTTYATYTVAPTPIMRKVDALLRPLFSGGGVAESRRFL